MIRIMTARRLRELEDKATKAGQERDDANVAAEMANDSAIRAEGAVERLLKQLDQARDENVEQYAGLHAVIKTVTAERDDARVEVEGARVEVEEARAQVLLDAEDRVALRALLRTARKKAAQPDRVWVLLQHGELHSVHASQDDAEAAAEAEGAPRDGWTWDQPSVGIRPAQEVAWKVKRLPLGGVR
ncbi:hypothetical protein [Streptomyces zaomyceticus]|uniref:hypothetical protein n=1 Tax=Streptomyces zaomyceticus TaxID=68286 RepID=UPI003788062C